MIRKIVPVLLLCLGGCGNLKDYDVTLNERVVYTPRPLTVDDAIEDPALAACIAQTLEDQNLSRSGQLQSLRCTQAGIVSLDGIQVYPAISGLKLTGNAIADITPLLPLTQLENLWLNDNALVNVGALVDLTSLAQLKLSGNPALNCESAAALPVRRLELPEHCAR